MKAKHVLAWLGIVALAIGSSAASAQDANAGKTKYNSFPWQCSQCHNANPKSDPNANTASGGVKTGAQDWHYIQEGIEYTASDGNHDMTDLLSPLYFGGQITDADLQDISAYLATVFGTGGTTNGTISAPASLSFATAVTVGQWATQSFNVTVSTAAVTFISFSISPSTDFSISSNGCSGTVNPGTCSIGITFAPSANGARSATLSITSNGGNKNVGLSGTGTGGGGGGSAQLQMPGNYDFGNQTVGTQSAPQSFTVRNVGSGTASISSVTSSDPASFPITSNGCNSVAAGASCTVGIAFAPQSAGGPLATVTITSNGVGSPQTFRITGTGVPPANPGQLAMPGPVNFAAQTVGTQSAAQTVTIANTGGQSVTVSSVASSDAAEFPITANNCTSVAVGANCTVSLAFKPSAAGAHNATITVTSNGIGSPQSFNASGTGTAQATPGQLSMPAAVNFASQTVGVESSAQTATMTNVGGQSVTINGVASSSPAEFPVVSTTCTGAIAAGAGCQVSLAFKPSASGARSATITVTSTGVGSPQSFGTSGTGVANAPGQLALPGSITLPTMLVGTQSSPTTVTVSNSGGAGVTISGISSSNASEFSVVSDTCTGSLLAPGAQCTFGVAFHPSTSGARSATITLASNAANNPVSLSATGNAAIAGGMDLNQQGITGSWYQPTTSGQGVEIEVYPNLVAAGTGFMQGSWFTFDYTAAGGASSQRWYTFSGNVQSGQSTATFTMYQNVGGNFNALPVTQAVAVGTVTLNFSDCTHATMNFTFTDGSSRSGSISLVRLTPNIACSTTGANSTNPDFGYSGNWFDPGKGGQGLVFELNPAAGVVFFAWYTYAPNGVAQGAAGQRWYTGQANFSPGMRTLQTTVYETTGGMFNSAAPAPHTDAVGTATITFTSCAAATLAYNLTGGSSAGSSATINLSRVGPTPAGCGP